MRGHRGRVLAVGLLAGLLLAAPGSPDSAGAQQAPGLIRQAGATEFQFSLARTLYSRNGFCGLWEFFVSGANFTASRGALGLSVSLLGDYPWPTPPPIENTYRDRGLALQGMVELYPLLLLGEEAARLDRYLRPFVGVGVQASQDGETYEAGTERPGDVWAVLGRVDPGVSYGASVRFPVGDRLGLVARFQGTTLFSGDAEFRSPGGEVITQEGENLNWGEVRLGFSFIP